MVSRGLPKKGGAGGKGTWGDVMTDEGPAVFDMGDPNYQSVEDLTMEGETEASREGSLKSQ